MPRIAIAAVSLALCFFVTSRADAQQRPRTGAFVNFNVALEDGPGNLSVAVPATVFDVGGSIDVDDSVGGANLIDGSAGIRVGPYVFGGGYSTSSSSTSSQFTASTTPFGSSSFTRSVNGVTPALEHRERVVYVTVGASKMVTDRFEVVVSTGPAFFKLTQDLPEDITQGPLPFGNFVSMSTRRVTESALGLYGSLDLSYMFHPRIGMGGLFRYTRGSVDLPDSTDPMTLGGIHVGAGARVRF